jgi:tyrosyl-tRNA synthetase
MDTIRHYEAEMKKNSYIANTAQKKLAEEMTRMLHGEEGLEKALRVTEGANPGSKTQLDPEVFQEIAKDMPHFSLKREEVIGQKLVDLFAKTGLSSSKSEAVRLIEGGGAYLNNDKVQTLDFRLAPEHLIGDKYLLLAAGKKKKLIIQIE